MITPVIQLLVNTSLRWLETCVHLKKACIYYPSIKEVIEKISEIKLII